MEELIFLHRRFINNDLHALRLNTLHDPLNGRSAEVIGTALHDQTINTHHFRLTRENGIRDEVFTRAVGIHNGRNQVVRHRLIVSQQLLGIFWQAVTTVTEGRVVVMVTDTRVKTHALDDLTGVQT